MPHPQSIIWNNQVIMDFFPSTLYLDLDLIQTPVHRFPTSKDSFIGRNGAIQVGSTTQSPL